LNRYEELTQETADLGLVIKEKPLKASDGRIKRNRVAIRSTLPTSTQKACVLAEELGHHHTTYGNIIDFSKVSNRKQERKARLWGYNRLVGLYGLIRAFERGCRNKHEIADYLEVTEEYLDETINCYREKYGEGKGIDNYYVAFEPSLQILKMI